MIEGLSKLSIKENLFDYLYDLCNCSFLSTTMYRHSRITKPEYTPIAIIMFNIKLVPSFYA
jgi:hypothetical protein